MVDSWVNCGQCGHRFDAFRSNCPRCGRSNSHFKANSHGTSRGKKIGIIAGSVIGIFAILAVIGSTSKSGSDSSIGTFIGDFQNYDGLTEQQISHVKMVREQCDNQVATATAISNEAGKKIQEKCDKIVADDIAKFKVENQNNINAVVIDEPSEKHDNIAKMNETAVIGNIPYRVTNIEVYTVLLDSSGSFHRTEDKYVVVDIEMGNRLGKSIQITPSQFVLTDSLNHETSLVNNLLNLPDEFGAPVTVQPSSKISKKLYFELPANGLEESYNLQISGTDAASGDGKILIGDINAARYLGLSDEQIDSIKVFEGNCEKEAMSDASGSSQEYAVNFNILNCEELAGAKIAEFRGQDQ